MAARRPCLRCGTPTQGRFCATCLPKTHRYRPERWKRLSRRLRATSGCAVCGSTTGLQVHHRTPLAQGGAEYDAGNLVVLCERHHAEAHAGKAV